MEDSMRSKQETGVLPSIKPAINPTSELEQAKIDFTSAVSSFFISRGRPSSSNLVFSAVVNSADLPDEIKKDILPILKTATVFDISFKANHDALIEAQPGPETLDTPGTTIFFDFDSGEYYFSNQPITFQEATGQKHIPKTKEKPKDITPTIFKGFAKLVEKLQKEETTTIREKK